MDISKKELLKETGISYGQLYRWKREGLIPDAWFEKRSSFTGQETYFPREAVLKRIMIIQELKDHYSLEELATLLSPENSAFMFGREDLAKITEIQEDVAVCFMDCLQKDTFTYYEMIIMIAFTKCIEQEGLSLEEIKALVLPLKSMPINMQRRNQIMIMVKANDVHYIIMLQENTNFYIDDRLQVRKKIHLDEISDNMKLKYKHMFQFTTEKEESL